MPVRHPHEIELCKIVMLCRDCERQEIGAVMGLHGGVLITCGGKPVGMWLADAQGLAFEFLQAGHDVRQVADPAEAVRLMVSMAEAGTWLQ